MVRRACGAQSRNGARRRQREPDWGRLLGGPLPLRAQQHFRHCRALVGSRSQLSTGVPTRSEDSSKLRAMPSLGRGWALLLTLVCACSKASKSNEHGARAPGAASAKVEAALPSAVAAASAAGGALPAGLACDKINDLEAARRLMNAWNAALNAHDVARLESLYAPRVSFYGRDFSRDQVIAAKRKALAASPAFKQRLSDIQIAAGDSGASATFDKVSGAKPVRGSLVVACADGAVYTITAESDAPSDALAQNHEDCEAAMHAVAFSLPEVTKAMTYATDEAPFGGLSYPTEGKHYSAALGYHHEDHFEAAFFLDWAHGVFTINQGDVKVPPAGIARVKAACPK